VGGAIYGDYYHDLERAIDSVDCLSSSADPLYLRCVSSDTLNGQFLEFMSDFIYQYIRLFTDALPSWGASFPSLRYDSAVCSFVLLLATSSSAMAKRGEIARRMLQYGGGSI